MPTYAYRCADCGHAFDIQQSFTDDALTACPECGGSLRKVFSSVGVVFKGSGFYRNDSRAGAKGASKGAAAKEPAKPTGAGSASSDAGSGGSAATSGAGSSTGSTSSSASTGTSGSAGPGSSGTSKAASA